MKNIEENKECNYLIMNANQNTKNQPIPLSQKKELKDQIGHI